MDGKDRKILALLQADGRLGYGEIGKKVGLAASSVHERVRKLERSGAIKGYRAEVDLAGAGMPITAIVSLALSPSSPSDIPAKIAELDLVESCYSVAGDNSYALVVRAPSTNELEELLDTLRGKLEVTTRATIVLSTPFEHRPLLGRL
ncbi:MAG: Lrp/AsnC family transcriptional regulator, leucine-responsive regulatory protein [Actinomycetota bacterium]|jgi:Lrp/AsnC family leucine-responsive transcriptional regulator|nr:Lrp/AsnC family transcriptional regulator, leucine-responsive regulatory protein [Actinomycetota bacterium]